VSAVGIALTLALGSAFGFALQRGGFCGAAMLSTVVLYKDKEGIIGILVAVLVSMVGFAVLSYMGWIIPNPTPMRLLSAIVGGSVFGVGMVLAGGCVTGTLYKAAEGRLTSILALVTIGVGTVAVDDGMLASAKRGLVVATRSVRGPAALDEALGMPYHAVAATIGATGLTALLIAALRRRRSGEAKRRASVRSLVTSGWTPAQAGAVVGILGWLAYLSSGAADRNYPLSGNGGVKGAFTILVRGEFSGSHWTIYLVLGLLAGSALSARLRGDQKLRSGDPATLLIALFGGLLVGIGASLGRGCFIGNSVSGLALLSLHSAVFAVCTVAANWLTTLLYLRGIQR
jgi:uncharacterized membrane protein YedE/YeeE